MKKIIFLLFLHYSILSFGLTPEEYCTPTPKNACVTPYGMVLGESENVKSFSNCRSECVKNVPNFIPGRELKVKDEVFAGVAWQCVEYARRWWMLERGIRFGSVDTANEIFTLTEATRLIDNKIISLKSFANGSTTPPDVGDLLVYEKQKNKPEFQYGHVAVIVGVNLNNGYVDVAEQNYDNKSWASPAKYSRRIAIELKNNKYTVYDTPYAKFNPAKPNKMEKEMIMGWVSPVF